MERFRDRRDAGVALARLLEPLLEGTDAVVLGVPRGGVVVGRAVADALALPLDVIVVRKLGVPGREEFGFGAIGEGGVRVVDQAILAAVGLSDAAVEEVARREGEELRRRVEAYRGSRPPLDVAGRVAVIVDDGVATGGTIRAAIGVTRALGASRVVVGAGVAPLDVIESLASEADDAIAAIVPGAMWAVGQWYDDFAQVSDDEVVEALRA